MMLGKRPRPPMKRTRSVTEITFDLSCINNDESQPFDPHNPFKTTSSTVSGGTTGQRRQSGGGHRRNSTDFVETNNNINNYNHFLRACFLCKRRLVPSRDIYMYRGDSAFCSLECRQQQMNQDEVMEKCSLSSKKELAAHHHHVSTAVSTSAARSHVSTKPETTVAAL
ncbi:Zf-FLZ domain containing protein [Parasponia andersonii]|uniref:Zf-FLZ domain containing protein n=1 Tax=Parasponia andersonii TaxID=3476 RepID=A0A2P5CKN9_PARAD|nr:Zf-FLZ domain containing protein [Parasponia andersonii]